MTGQLLVSAQDLQALLERGECTVFDCRFVVEDPDAGFEDYLDSHIPGAAYAHLDHDLSSPISAVSGRHPLPEADRFALFLSRAGWQPGKLLVAYDDAGGAIAARLWWLMKYFGQDCAALLDGGIQAWWAAGFELARGPGEPFEQDATVPAGIKLCADDGLVVSTQDVINHLGKAEVVLADARANERFTGKIEPIDAVAGHIPGSVSYPYNRNLNPIGTFKRVEHIRADLQALIGAYQSEDLVHMCGSGVTACNNLFAAELVGLAGSRLYVGSWSEWIRDPSRPVG